MYLTYTYNCLFENLADRLGWFYNKLYTVLGLTFLCQLFASSKMVFTAGKPEISWPCKISVLVLLITNSNKAHITTTTIE